MNFKKLLLPLLLAAFSNSIYAEELQLVCNAKSVKGADEQWTVWVDLSTESIKFASYSFEKGGGACGGAMAGNGSRCSSVSIDDQEIIFKMELSPGTTFSKYVISRKSGRIKITNVAGDIKYDGTCTKIATNAF